MINMNAHQTPRPFTMRSVPGGSMQGLSSRQQGKQPLVSQISEHDEFNSLPDEDREHIDEVFDLMDMKKKGYLNSYEFRHSLAALGLELPKPEYYRQLEHFGSQPEDWPEQANCPVNRLLVYADQFRMCAARLMANRDPREEAEKVFRMFDYDGDNLIGPEDMRHLANDIKEERTMTDEEIRTMIEHLDHSGKGGVDLDEFIQMMEEAG